MLFPLFPLNPHLLVKPSSVPSDGPEVLLSLRPFLLAKSSRGVLGLEFRKPPGLDGLEELPPKIAETDECAHRACFLIADVTVIHSVVMSATGSIATEIGVYGLLEPFNRSRLGRNGRIERLSDVLKPVDSMLELVCSILTPFKGISCSVIISLMDRMAYANSKGQLV